jgi:transporter family protein
MSWLLLALSSAFFLGFYDLAKKKSVQGNAVRPVLFLCSAFYALFMLPILVSGHTETLVLREHVFLMGKALIVGGSWLLTYNAIAHMPLSISATIRALAPPFYHRHRGELHGGAAFPPAVGGHWPVRVFLHRP